MTEHLSRREFIWKTSAAIAAIAAGGLVSTRIPCSSNNEVYPKYSLRSLCSQSSQSSQFGTRNRPGLHCKWDNAKRGLPGGKCIMVRTIEIDGFGRGINYT